MSWFRDLVLYASLTLGANAAMAEGVDIATLEALREGSIKKLMFHAAPKDVAPVAFVHEDGSDMTLTDLQGKYLLVNFWATWCAPCRKEMPALDALQRDLGGPDFEVVTIATGRNSEAALRRFFKEESIDHLPLHRDPKQKLAREMAVLGLPITVLIDRKGREIARLRGDAEWDSDSARAIVAALIADAPPEG